MPALKWICNCKDEIEAQGFIDKNRQPGYAHKVIFHPVDGGVISERFAEMGLVGLYGEKEEHNG
jgi:hypothetical protein